MVVVSVVAAVLVARVLVACHCRRRRDHVLVAVVNPVAHWARRGVHRSGHLVDLFVLAAPPRRRLALYRVGRHRRAAEERTSDNGSIQPEKM